MPIQIVPSGTSIDFIGKGKACAIASGVLILVGLVAAATGQLRWGIDFAGGTEIQVHFEAAETDEAALRGVVGGLVAQDVSVIRFGDPSEREFLIRFGGSQGSDEGDSQGEVVDRIQAALAEQVGALRVDRVEYVGPKVGAELRQAGLKALGIAGLLILAYIWFRFTLRFAPGAIVALLHDVLITSSIWVLLGQEFNLQVLAALLAIVGYSLNDTIIVYDRIRENMELRTTRDLPEVLNRSVNQTLSRTVLTSGTTLLTVGTLLALGGAVIFPFALTMAIGIVVGTYSSVYIAAPTLMLLERRYGDAPPSEGSGRGEGRKPAAKKTAGKSGKGRRAKAAAV